MALKLSILALLLVFTATCTGDAGEEESGKASPFKTESGTLTGTASATPAPSSSVLSDTSPAASASPIAATPPPLPTPEALSYSNAVPLAVAVSTDKPTYALGEPITFNLTAENVSGGDLLLNYPDGTDYQFIVLWQEVAFTTSPLSALPTAQEETVPNGWRRIESWTWDQTYHLATPEMQETRTVAPGTYQVVGVWHANGCIGNAWICPNASEPVTFEIVE